jgi:hypothetical protein
VADLCIANNNFVGILISKNDERHRFGETKGEFFVNLIRDFIQDVGGGEITDDQFRELWNRAKKKQTDYGELVAQRPILKMLMDSWFMQHYFATTILFKPSFLYDQIGVHGAVSASKLSKRPILRFLQFFAWAVQQGLKTFRVLPSQKDFASVQEVHRVISLMRAEGPKITEATQKLVDGLDEGIALDADEAAAVDAAATTFWRKDMLVAINDLVC